MHFLDKNGCIFNSISRTNVHNHTLITVNTQ